MINTVRADIMMVLMMIISTVSMGIDRRHQGDFDALS
jgi:hypothetical protein